MLTLGCVVMAEESGSRIDRPEHYRPTRALHAGGFAGQDELFTRHEVIRRQIEETRFRTAEAQLKLAEAQNATELKLHETSEKLDALIKIADEWTRNRPNAPNQEAYLRLLQVIIPSECCSSWRSRTTRSSSACAFASTPG